MSAESCGRALLEARASGARPGANRETSGPDVQTGIRGGCTVHTTGTRSRLFREAVAAIPVPPGMTSWQSQEVVKLAPQERMQRWTIACRDGQVGPAWTRAAAVGER